MQINLKASLAIETPEDNRWYLCYCEGSNWPEAETLEARWIKELGGWVAKCGTILKPHLDVTVYCEAVDWAAVKVGM